MKVLRGPWTFLGFVLLAVSASAGTSPGDPPFLGERLEYTLSYEGLLSGGQRVDVADVVMRTEPDATRFNGQPVYRTRVHASTQGHRTIDRIYPFRYEFSSLMSTDLQRSVLFESRKEGRKEGHTVVWFDWDDRRLARFRAGSAAGADAGSGFGDLLDSFGGGAEAEQDGLAQAARSLLRRLGVLRSEEHYEAEAPPGPALPERLFDRLSMLQVLRLADLAPGRSWELPVSDGENLLTYQVEVLGRETLATGARTWDTHHLRLTAYEVDKPAEPRHPPVELWLATDEARTPVRFSSRRKLGRFDVQLRGGAGPAEGGADAWKGPDQLASVGN